MTNNSKFFFGFKLIDPRMARGHERFSIFRYVERSSSKRASENSGEMVGNILLP